MKIAEKEVQVVEEKETIKSVLLNGGHVKLVLIALFVLSSQSFAANAFITGMVTGFNEVYGTIKVLAMLGGVIGMVGAGWKMYQADMQGAMKIIVMVAAGMLIIMNLGAILLWFGIDVSSADFGGATL
jgi:hypothetical protein